MNSTDSRGYPIERPAAFAGTDNLPTSCPACRSPSIVTTSKNPDESSYWRGRGCGEIWNAGRFRRTVKGGAPWR